MTQDDISAARPGVRDLIRAAADAADLHARFDRHYPGHWRQFCGVVASLREAGVGTWGARGVLGHVRCVGAPRGDDHACRVDNNTPAYLSRTWRRDHPAARAFFKLRMPAAGFRADRGPERNKVDGGHLDSMQGVARAHAARREAAPLAP